MSAPDFSPLDPPAGKKRHLSRRLPSKQRRGGSSTATTGWQQHQQHQQTARTKVRLLLARLASLAEP